MNSTTVPFSAQVRHIGASTRQWLPEPDSAVEQTNESQSNRLRDVVTSDNVKAMLTADRGQEADLISWKIRDFTEDDNAIGCFVISVDVRYQEQGKEYFSCYALKLDSSYVSEVLEEDLVTEEACVEPEGSSESTNVYFSLGSVDDSQVTAPFDLITASQVRLAIKADKGRDVRLISWDIPHSPKECDGGVSHLVTVDVIFRDKNCIQNTSYIVKCNSSLSHSESTCEYIKAFFSNETKAYTDLVSRMNSVLEGIGLSTLKFPRCLYFSDKPREEMLFFEDLRLRGFRRMSLWKGMDINHATLLIRELAKFHASSMLFRLKNCNGNSEGDMLVGLEALNLEPALNISKARVAKSLRNGVSRTLKILKHRSSQYSKAINWLDRNKSRFLQVRENAHKRSEIFDVLCHGSCWDNSTLFRYDDKNNPVEVMMINLQWSRPASLATDLTSFLLTSLMGSMRTQGRDILLTTYFESLQRALDAAGEDVPFSLQDLVQEFRSKQLFGVVFFLMFMPFEEQVGTFDLEDQINHVSPAVRVIGSDGDEGEDEDKGDYLEEEEDLDKEEEGLDREEEDEVKNLEETTKKTDEKEEEVGVVVEEKKEANGKEKEENEEKELFASLYEQLLYNRVFALFDDLEEEGVFDKDILEM